MVIKSHGSASYPESQERARVNDGRRGKWFWLDHDIIDQYAARIGPYALCVYTYLCRRAGENGESWPSQNTISSDLGMSRNTVRKAIETLVENKLISVTVERNEDGSYKSCTYTLLEVAESKNAEPNKPRGVVHEVNKGCARDEQGVVHEVNKGCARDEQKEKPVKKNQLNKAEHDAVQTLLGIPKWDMNRSETIKLIAVASESYSNVDLHQLSTDFAFKLITNPTAYKYPASAFGGWVRQAGKQVRERKRESEVREVEL